MFNRFKNFIRKYFDNFDQRSIFSDAEILTSIEQSYEFIYDNYGYSNLEMTILIHPDRFLQIEKYLTNYKYKGLLIMQYPGLKKNDIIFLPDDKNERE